MSIQYIDLSVIVASLCGALVWMMTQKYFNRYKQPVAFSISFIMGIIGADLTLEIAKSFFPDIYTDERAIGAFFCSALIVTIITKLTCYINNLCKKI